MTARPPAPVHASMLGRAIPSTCRPAAGCKCEPIQLVDLEFPSRPIYLHRAERPADVLTSRAARLADFADSITTNEGENG
jgi:hypothetical protein